jgi:hypothetical protein
MKDNYSAGTTTLYVDEDNISGRFTTDTPYTDKYGRAYYVRCRLVSRHGAAYLNQYSNAYSLPEFSGNANFFGYINSNAPIYLLRKDSRERISYNFELEIKTDMEDIIIGSALASAARTFSSSTEEIEIGIAPGRINAIDRVYQGQLESGVTFDRFNNSTALRITNTATNLSPDAMWVIRTAVNPSTRTVVTETGEEITESTTTGGRVLLAGKFVNFNNNTRDIYFNITK